MTDIVERLRSRAEAPNVWTRPDYFLIEVADEITRLRAENGHQHDEISRLDKEIDRLRRDAEPGDGQWKMAVQEERERLIEEAPQIMLRIVNEWHRQGGIDEVMKTKLTRAIADTVATGALLRLYAGRTE